MVLLFLQTDLLPLHSDNNEEKGDGERVDIPIRHVFHHIVAKHMKRCIYESLCTLLYIYIKLSPIIAHILVDS